MPGSVGLGRRSFIPEENFVRRVQPLFSAAAARRSARTRRVIARRGSCKIFVSGQPPEADERLQAPPPAPSQRATQGFVTQIFEAVRPDKGGDLPVSRRARNPPQGRRVSHRFSLRIFCPPGERRFSRSYTGESNRNIRIHPVK